MSPVDDPRWRPSLHDVMSFAFTAEALARSAHASEGGARRALADLAADGHARRDAVSGLWVLTAQGRRAVRRLRVSDVGALAAA